MDKAPKIQRKACIRCGVCCLFGPCGYSEDEEDCRHLSFNEDGTATCGIYDKIAARDKTFASGCALRTWPELYKEAKGQAEAKIGRKIKGKE